MQDYQPSNRVAASGIVLLILVLFAGVILGGVVYLISQLVYVVFVFPFAMGFAGAALIEWAVRRGKVRYPLLAAAVGVLIGILMYGSMHALDYRSFRRGARTAIVENWGTKVQQWTPEVLEKAIDMVLVEETKLPGFGGYMILKAREGVSIVKVFGAAYHLGPFLSWVYWLVELAIISGLAAHRGFKAASQAYCEACGTWYGGGQHLGGMEETEASELLQLLQVGDFEQMGKMLAEDAELPSLDLYLASCDRCEAGESLLTVERNFVNARGKAESQRVLRGMISAQQKAALTE